MKPFFAIFTALQIFVPGIAYGQAMSEEEVMNAVRELASPGKEHALLESLSGRWKIKVHAQLTPDSEPEIAVGKAEYEWVLRGRFLRYDYSLNTRNSVRGLGYIGYDKMKREYVMANMVTTDTAISQGAGRANGRVIEFHVTINSVSAGKPVPARLILRLDGPDSHSYETWIDDPATRKPFRAVLMEYSRR